MPAANRQRLSTAAPGIHNRQMPRIGHFVGTSCWHVLLARSVGELLDKAAGAGKAD
jgi:hypothetical protein